MKLRRTRGYVCFAAFVVTLLVWPFSYPINGVVAVDGYGVTADHGAYYLAAPDAYDGRTEANIHRIIPDYTIERMLEFQPSHWLPVRRLRSIVGSVIVLAAWVPPLLFAYPAWRTVRHWRRQRVEPGRGFEVARDA